MKERFARLKIIKKLIKSQSIHSQEVLLNHLQKKGFVLTQATLSRDLKLLKVGKLADGENGYIYALPGEDERQEWNATLIEDFLRGYVSIDYSGNIVVIRTYSGHADVVALALDNLAIDDILGTIAGGDNCVFACLKEGVSGETFLESLRKIIPEIDE